MNNQCNPNLCFDGILALPVKPLDAEVLLYLLEVQLHLPAFFINGSDFQGGSAEHVCQESNLLSGLIVAGYHLAQCYIYGVLFRVADSHPYDFIPPYREAVVGLFPFVRGNHLVFNVALIPCDKRN